MMQLKIICLVVFVTIVWLAIPACQKEADTPGQFESSIAQTNPDSTLFRLRLTERVVESLDLKTAAIREQQTESSGMVRKVIPKSAVLTDPEGNTWIYTNPDSGLYVRRHVRFDNTDGDLAVFTDGPPAGTSVVVVGADKLFLKEIGGIR